MFAVNIKNNNYENSIQYLKNKQIHNCLSMEQ